MFPENIKTKLRHFIVAFIFITGLSGSLCIAAPPEPPSHVRAVSLADGVVKLWWDHSPSVDKGDVKAYRIYGRRKRDPLHNKVYRDKFKLYAEVDAKYQYWQSQPLKQIHIWKSQGLSFKHPKQWFGEVELQPGLEYDFLVRAVGNEGRENRDRFVIHKDDTPDPAGKYSNFTTKYPWWRFPGGVGNVNRNAAYHDMESGSVWFGTAGGAMRCKMLENGKIESKLYAPVDGLIGYDVYTIAKDKNGKFWFGTDAGISVYDPANERCKSYTAEVDGLTGDEVRYIAVHPQTGDVWAGTNAGVDQFSESGVKHFRGYEEYTITEEGLTLEELTRIVKEKFSIKMPEETLGIQIVQLNSELFRKKENTDERLSIEELYRASLKRVLPNKIQLKIPTSPLHFGTDGWANRICFKRESPNQVLVATNRGGVSVIEDGRVTKIYDKTTGLPENFTAVNALMEDAHGRIWVSTYQGVSVIENGQVTQTFDKTTRLPDNSVVTLLEDTHGRIWIATYLGVSVIEDRQITQTYNKTTGLPANFVAPHLLEDMHGRIWIGTANDGVSVIEEGRVTQTFDKKKGLSYNSLETLLEDAHGRIWVGASNGVSVIEGEQVTQTFDKTAGLPSNYVSTLLEDVHGRIWVGASSGVSVIEGEQVTQTYDKTTGLVDNFVLALQEDVHGRIFVYMGNLVIYVKGRNLVRYQGTFIQEYHGSVCVIENGQIAKTFKITGLVKNAFPTSDQTTQAFLFDTQGRIWVGTAGGGVSIIENGQVIQTFDKTYFVQALLEDANKRIWVGTGSGVSIIENGQVIQTFDKTTGLANYSVLALLEDASMRIWVGTIGGVSVIEEGQVVQTFDKTTGLPDDHVQALLEDEHGRIWVGTSVGVSVIENGQVIQTFDKTTWLSGDRVEALLEDEHGRIWVGTFFGGLNVINPHQPLTTVVKVMFAVFLALCASPIGYKIYVRYRGQIDPNETARDFFMQARFLVERVSLLRLRLKATNPSYSDYHHLSVTTLQEEIVEGPTVDVLFEDLKRTLENVYGQIAYFVYPDKLSARAILCLRALKIDHNFTLIPLKAAVLRDAIFAGNCRNTLTDLERPYLGSGDLYDTRNAIYDPMWFFGRGYTINEVIGDVNRGQHIGIFGMRKVGKSSLTKQLEYRLGSVPKVSFDLQGIANVTASSFIFSHILDGLRQYIHATYPDMQLPASRLRNEAGTSVSEELDATQVFSEELSTLRQILVEQNEERRIIIFIDEADTIVPNDKSSEAAYREFTTAFGTLRSIAEEGGFLVLVVIGLDPDINRINRLSKGNVSNNPVFQFYKEVHVPCLAEEECATMVKEIGLWRNLKYDNASLDEIYKMSGGHPFVARLLCSCIVRNLDGKNEVDLEDVQKGIDYFLTERTGTYQAYFDGEIWDRASEAEQHILEKLAESSVLSGQELMPDRESRERLKDALDRLVRLALVEEDGNGYHITMKLFELWLKEEVL